MPRKSIAIIDDDYGVRRAMRRLVETAGYRVRVFASAEEFFEIGLDGVIDCLVVDVDLGSTSGLDVAANPVVAERRVPIIFVSGSSSDAARREAKALGAQYVGKPFAAVDLLRAISNAVGPAHSSHEH